MSGPWTIRDHWNRAPAFLIAVFLGLLGGTPASAYEPPPANAKFDYQIGDPYQPSKGTRVVSRDWFEADPLPGKRSYSICYVNAFQTQDDSRSVDRPDERSNWPADLVLSELGDDPNWRGEYLVDISTTHKRERAAEWIEQMTDTCAAKGFDAVEYDNLDSWTQFRRTEVADQVPIGRSEAIAFAELITDRAHALDLAVAQKNTVQLSRKQARERVGFDFTAPGSKAYRYRACGGPGLGAP